MSNYNETIAAIATASGSGSISIIRVSGPDAFEIVDGVFFHGKNDSDQNCSHCSENDNPLFETTDKFRESGDFLINKHTHTIHYGWIGSAPDQLIDEVLVLLMRAPRSYTAEDVVEIHCHGGGLAAGKILDLLLEKGVRLAEPGEFTKRAFLNGRIDLTQAESVMEVIRARSDLALNTAGKHLRGDVRDRIYSMREIILTDMAYLEAALDDPEHIELDDFQSILRSHLDPIREEIDLLLKHAENGRLISEGIRTAIIGRPNVGKSSFLNCILREDRAIVTDIPGTTRDTLEEEVRIGGVLLRLIDTAGIRETDDPVEKIGVDRARNAMKDADFVIHIIDSAEPLSDEDKVLLSSCSSGSDFINFENHGSYVGGNNTYKDAELFGAAENLSSVAEIPCVIVLNKSDLKTITDVDDVAILFDDKKIPPIIEFSAKTGDGLEKLESLLNELLLKNFYGNNIDDTSEPLITSKRQKEFLIDSADAIARVYETMDSGMPEDLLTVDLLAAYESLGRITGETVEDDLADKIFSEFCMGK